jgi:hypothetical protein
MGVSCLLQCALPMPGQPELKYICVGRSFAFRDAAKKFSKKKKSKNATVSMYTFNFFQRHPNTCTDLK